MKKSAKKFCLKLAASILSTTIVASIALPMNVLATTVDTTTEILSENTTMNSSSPDYSDNIIREVEEERDEFSKTFLMSDGTYYTYVSPVAIHEFIEDKWVDIDDSLSETPATIPEAEETVKEYINEAGYEYEEIIIEELVILKYDNMNVLYMGIDYDIDNDDVNDYRLIIIKEVLDYENVVSDFNELVNSIEFVGNK